MIKKRLFFALYIGFLVYILLTLIFGTSGLLSYMHLEQYQLSLQNNLIELQEIYHSLRQDLRAFHSNPQTIKQYSHELGYFAQDENVIRIMGIIPLKSYYKVGTILRRNQKSSHNSPLFHIIGLAVFGLVFLLSYIRFKIKNNGY